MLKNDSSGSDVKRIVEMTAGSDRFGEQRSLGISTILFKVCSPESDTLLVLENVFHAKGGPARHLHYEQDEWFYVLEGEFQFVVGDTTLRLGSGSSVLGPRNIPHVWAHVGEGTGRILVAFTPPGKMEAFFRLVTKTSAMPIQDPLLWKSHGMELLGPPLTV